MIYAADFVLFNTHSECVRMGISGVVEVSDGVDGETCAFGFGTWKRPSGGGGQFVLGREGIRKTKSKGFWI